ncbi:MAG: CDP-alcohol phosphatidyltransferase family protein [Deltaproteobacteria bacterium]|nr:CDP-alcohol phosphatidyltransferase family protein [Deltaproteobacteria bacterium]
MKGYFETYRTVKKSFKQSVYASLPPLDKITRQISFLMTPLFIRCHISANAASYLKGVSGLVASLLLCLGTQAGLVLGIMLYFVTRQIMDLIDGNIARVTGTSSFYGKFIDGFMDVFLLSLFRLALAYYLYANHGPILLVWTGTLTALLASYQHLIPDRYSAFRRWINDLNKVNEEVVRIKSPTLPIISRWASRLHGVFLAVSIFEITVGLTGFFVVSLCDSLCAIYLHFKAAKNDINVRKISPKAAEDFVASNHQ